MRKPKHCPVCRSTRYTPIIASDKEGFRCKRCGYTNIKMKNREMIKL